MDSDADEVDDDEFDAFLGKFLFTVMHLQCRVSMISASETDRLSFLLVKVFTNEQFVHDTDEGDVYL